MSLGVYRYRWLSTGAAALALVLCGCTPTTRASLRVQQVRVYREAANARAVTRCGADRPIEQRSKVDSELRIVCIEWASQGAPKPPVTMVLIELVSADTRELEETGFAFEPLNGRFFSAKVSVELFSTSQSSAA